MIKEAIEFVLGLAKPDRVDIDGLPYFSDGNKDLVLVTTPTFGPVNVRTLSGLVDLITASLEGLTKNATTEAGGSQPVLTNQDVFILVKDHLNVELVTRVSDKYGRRHTLGKAYCDEDGKFQLERFLQPEFFVIGLQSCFMPGVGDIDYLMRVASNLTTEAIAVAEDDGISQKATIRKSVVLSKTEILKARVTLAPYRTFREADQPASDFVFRVKSGGEGEPPLCALFEADGGKWKNDAMANVAKYLSFAVYDIPVIS